MQDAGLCIRGPSVVLDGRSMRGGEHSSPPLLVINGGLQMTFLKRFGMLLLKATQVVTGIAPVYQNDPHASSVIQEIQTDLGSISAVIGSIEAVGQALNLPGPEKLKAAAPQVAQVILRSALLAKHKIKDETLFAQGSTKIADGMADILNSLDADGVDTIVKT